MLNPFADELAQATEAYTSLRMPYLNEVLLRCDRESPEWDKAAAEFDELALRSGLRTDHLPTEAERAARALKYSGMADASATPPDPAPSAMEVKALETAYYENAALQARPVHVSDIDDRRGAQAVRIPTPQRSYMDPGPGVRDLGVR